MKRKVHLNLYLDADLHARLANEADRTGESIPRITTRYLTDALHLEAEAAEVSTLQAALTRSLEAAAERGMTRVVARSTNRLARLLARCALESIATRQATLMAHGKVHGVEEAVRIGRDAWNRAVERLKQPVAEIEDLLAGSREAPLE